MVGGEWVRGMGRGGGKDELGREGVRWNGMEDVSDLERALEVDEKCQLSFLSRLHHT
jgi:hypothetical protein